MQARLTDFRELTARKITGFDCITIADALKILQFCTKPSLSCLSFLAKSNTIAVELPSRTNEILSLVPTKFWSNKNYFQGAWDGCCNIWWLSTLWIHAGGSGDCGKMMVVYPSHACLIWGNKEQCQYLFLTQEVALVAKILPHGRQWPACPTRCVIWLLMAWQCKKPLLWQPWCCFVFSEYSSLSTCREFYNCML